MVGLFIQYDEASSLFFQETVTCSLNFSARLQGLSLLSLCAVVVLLFVSRDSLITWDTLAHCPLGRRLPGCVHRDGWGAILLSP